MSVRKHGNRWQVRVRVGGGRRIERTLPPGATRADALAVESQIRRTQIDLAAGRKPDLAIDALLDRWIAEEASRQKSWSVTQYKVGVLREYTAGRPLSQIQEVAGLIRRVDAKPATLNRYLSILRRLSNLAERWGLVDRAPKIDLFPEHNERHVYYTPAEVGQLAKVAGGEVGDVIRFAALTGLRRSELLGIKELYGGAVLLDARTKSGRPRLVPLTPEALRIARRRIPWTVTAQDIRRDFERARKALGLPQRQFRDLRNTFASWLAQDGQNLKAIQDLLGHAQLTTTQRYAHLAAGHLKAAVGGLPKLGVRAGTGKKAGRAEKAAR